MGARAAVSTLAFTLRSQPFRDSDLIVTLFTQELGKVSALARAARRSQRRFAGALGQLVVAQVELSRSPRAELWTLESASVERQWLELASDVAALAHASYAVELVRELLPAETPEPEAFALVVELWDSLGAGASAAGLRYLELQLLSLAGTPPALESCAACGANLAATQACLFDPARGGAMCSTCAPHSRGAGARPLSSAARRYLQAVAAAPSVEAARELERELVAAGAGAGGVDWAPDAAERAAARDAMLAMIRIQVPHELKTVEFIAKLNQAGS